MADDLFQYASEEPALATVDVTENQRAKCTNRLELQDHRDESLSIELGRTCVSQRHASQLRCGSVVELDKLVDEDVDVFANGRLVARGEVLVIDNCLSVRVTEVISAGLADKKETQGCV